MKRGLSRRSLESISSNLTKEQRLLWGVFSFQKESDLLEFPINHEAAVFSRPGHFLPSILSLLQNDESFSRKP